MRVFISADMEGVAGVARDEQTDPAARDRPEFRRLMIGEVNAAVEGAREGGATDIFVGYHASAGTAGAVLAHTYADQSPHPSIARRRIQDGACPALGRLREISPMRLAGGVELEVDFLSPAMCDSCERVPGVERRSARTVAYRSGDYLEVYELFLALVDLAEAVA